MSADATAVTEPFLMISAAGSEGTAVFPVLWTGATPDLFIEDKSDTLLAASLTMGFKVYPNGGGDSVMADMHDAGDANFPRIYIIKYQ